MVNTLSGKRPGTLSEARHAILAKKLEAVARLIDHLNAGTVDIRLVGLVRKFAAIASKPMGSQSDKGYCLPHIGTRQLQPRKMLE